MSSLYLRGKTWWVGYKTSDGKWVYQSTGCAENQKLQAQTILAKLEAAIARGHRVEEGSALTVASYAEQWTARRVESGLSNAKRDLARLRLKFLPKLGAKKLGDVRPLMIREFVHELRKADLASRTVINTYGLVRRLFNDALAEELIVATPCVLQTGDLPKKRDKNPSFRKAAVFTRDEVEQLMGDERVPEDRRVAYALAFFTGMRQGEIAALRWEAYDTDASPLGALSVEASYSRANGYVKLPKTDKTRQVPVHPVLSKVLASWRLSGWANLFKRHPKPDDLVVPNRHGKFQTDLTLWGNLQADLKKLGLRPRRFHDTRRTTISLARVDGAKREHFKCITHDATGDQFDQYTTYPWETLCEAMLQLKLEIRTGKVLRIAAGSGAHSTEPTTSLTTITQTNGPTMQNDSDSEACPRRDSNSSGSPLRSIVSGTNQGIGPVTGGLKRRGREVQRSNATTVSETLALAASAYDHDGDAGLLADRLQALITRLRRGDR